MKFKTKVNRFGVNNKFQEESIAFFNRIDDYSSSIKNYIYTDIDILSAEMFSQEFFQARTQISLSSILMRSIYLNEAAIVQLNTNNLVWLFAVLKSFLEVPASLGYLLYILNKNISNKERLDLFAQLHLGNRWKWELAVWDLEIKNVMTMFDKTEQELDKIFPEWWIGSKSMGKIIREFYELICNCSHPNYNAHAFIWTIEDEWKYNLFENSNFENSKAEEFNWYKPAWNTSILTIELISNLIVNHPTIKNFSKIKSRKYFL